MAARHAAPPLPVCAAATLLTDLHIRFGSHVWCQGCVMQRFAAI